MSVNPIVDFKNKIQYTFIQSNDEFAIKVNSINLNTTKYKRYNQVVSCSSSCR